jgi:hypothetical protein
MQRIVVIAAFVLGGAWPWLIARAAPPVRATPGPVQLEALVNQLDDDSYVRREEATKLLHAAGERAVDVLARGALSSSPEVAWRAGEALKRIAISGDERTLGRVAMALERVEKERRSSAVQVLGEIRARQKQMRHDRAAAQIRRLGGSLSGGAAGLSGEMFVDVGFLPVAIPVIEEAEVVEAKVEVEAAGDAAHAASEAAEKSVAAAEEFAKVAAVDAQPASDVPATEDAALPASTPPAELRKAVEGLFSGELSLEIVGGQRVEDNEPVREPADSIEDFRELADTPVEVDPANAKEVPAVEFLEGGDIVEVIGGVVFFGGPGGGVFEAAGEESMQAESLVLDGNWRGGDDGLAVLRDLPEVTTIDIHGAKLGDSALKHIAALPKLSNLHIRGTVFSVAALRNLHRAKPDVYLFCQGEAMVGIHADTTSGSCVLSSVYAGSGAADAGLRAGDKVVAIDGVEIRDFAELTISVYGHQVGEKLQVQFERDGKRQTAQVELKSRSVLER